MYHKDNIIQSILDSMGNPLDKIKQQPKPPYKEPEPIKVEKDLASKVLEELHRPSDAIPTFSYPFKRRKNTATKTKSEQEIYEEILFKDKSAQYLFNSSGLFHGGVHLKAQEFEMDFEVDGIRAIADGELIYYRIDKEYLKNKLEDEHSEFEVAYSTGFFLLEHKMEYPKGNRLKFYSLYMHTAPSYEYKFEEYVVMGASAYARKTSDHSKADDFVKFGDKVVLGRPIANKDGRYELLTVNGIKVPSGLNVHISNLQYEAVMTKVTGSKPNMRRGNTNKSPSEGLLKDGSKVKIHPYQTEEQKKNRRYKVLEAIRADGTEAIISSKSTIHASNIQAKIPEVHIYSKANNGIVQPHMKKMAGTNLKPASKDFKVKAGEELGKLGVYNSEWHETELDKVIHLEVFTFDDLKSFIKKAKKEYARPIEELSDEEKKIRPKENQFVIPKEEKELFILDDGIYGVTNTNTKIRKGMTQKDAEYKVVPSGTELELSSHKNTKRQKIKEWVGETLEANTTYSVHMKHIDYYQKFIPIPEESEVLTKTIRKSPNKLKIEKDKDQNEYVCIDERIRLYVKKKKEYFTHGITFSSFTIIDEAGADKIGIFEDVSKYYEKQTEEDETPQQDKEKLNDTFKAILQELKVDKDKNGRLEAGEFASLSLTEGKRKELSYMAVKHESEWEYQKEKFQPILDYLDQDPKQAKNKAMFEDRLEKLALFPKDIVGQGKTPTFFHPIALVDGFVNSGSGGCLRLEHIQGIFPIASDSKRKNVLNIFNEYCQAFEINTFLRIAHFFAQIKKEVGESINFKNENLNYSIKALKSGYPFAYFKTHHTQAELYGRGNGHAANQQMIANIAYDDKNRSPRYKLGNIHEGDGWNFRGKGFIQLTGRTNYEAANREIQAKVPDANIDIITNPESILTIKGAMVSSMAYWTMNNLNVKSDNAGWNQDNVDSITRVVNNGTKSYDARRENLVIIKEILEN
ncbi:MAG: glycoside hydrolase family 19 protein [bacterium]